MLIGTRPKSCTRWTKLSKTLYGALACNRTYQDYCRVVMILISDSLKCQYICIGLSILSFFLIICKTKGTSKIRKPYNEFMFGVLNKYNPFEVLSETEIKRHITHRCAFLDSL